MPKMGMPVLVKFTDRLHRVAERGGIAGAVGEENPGGLVLQNLCRGGGRGHNLNLETLLPEAAQNVVFHPEVEGDDRNIRRRQRLIA